MFGTCDELTAHFGCGQKTWAAPLLTSLMVLFQCIILLNLLIAMMSQTFGRVVERANEVWSFGRYRLIVETAALDPVPPPVNLPPLIARLVSRPFTQSFARRKRLHPTIASAGKAAENSASADDVMWIPSQFLAEMRTLYLDRHDTKVGPFGPHMNARGLTARLQAKSSSEGMLVSLTKKVDQLAASVNINRELVFKILTGQQVRLNSRCLGLPLLQAARVGLVVSSQGGAKHFKSEAHPASNEGAPRDDMDGACPTSRL